MIYIQSNKEKTLAHHFDVACAMYGAIDRGLDYRLTSFEEIESGKFDSLIGTRLFVGSVEFMREVFSRVGKSPRVPINSDRPSETIFLGEARERVERGEEFFIKPKELKLFSGMIVNKMYLSSLNPYPDKTEVLAYESFKYPILSEWRLYVHNKVVVDAKNYSGNFRVIPDWALVESRLKNFKDFPVSYTADIAVLMGPDGTHHNEIVEFNDMWAIGNYGIENTLYLRLLMERYHEIMRQG
jgi:hypothetical protein